MANAQRPAAAIVAGGAARRMDGVHKATLELGGIRIIERQLGVLGGVADPVFVVAMDAGPFAGLGVEVVADAIPGCGALGGIYTAIVASPRDRTFVVACDLPFLRAELFERMASVSGADLVIPRTVRGLEPLCALYSRSCAEPIRNRLRRGLLEARAALEALCVVEIGPETLARIDPDDLLFTNLNTPHDYARARKLLEAGTRHDRIMDEPRTG
ncbi:MAG TPA: molybdenum cofactor guanylyltransferase [Vicinamibacterales bacterium]|nr:molybdenum cofactor guanylyltransferase [Vicinamibacterales bacterium]